MPFGDHGVESASYSQDIHGLQNLNESSAVWDFADISDQEGSIPTAASERSTVPSDERQGLNQF